MVRRVNVSLGVVLLITSSAYLNAMDARAASKDRQENASKKKSLKRELKMYQHIANEVKVERSQDTPLVKDARVDVLVELIGNLQYREQALETAHSPMLESFRTLRISCQDKLKMLAEADMYEKSQIPAHQTNDKIVSTDTVKEAMLPNDAALILIGLSKITED